MGMGSGNFGNLIGNVANKGGATGAPAFNPSPFGGKGAPTTYDNYRPNYSYAAGPSYGNYQLPYSSGPYGSNYIPTPGGGAFGQKGGTMSPGFAPPSYGGMMNTLNYGRYPGSGVGYYDPTPEPNYNPSRPPSSGKGGDKPEPPYVGLPNPPMPGPPAKGGNDIPYVGIPAQPTPPSKPPVYVPYRPTTYYYPDGEN